MSCAVSKSFSINEYPSLYGGRRQRVFADGITDRPDMTSSATIIREVDIG